MTDEALDSAYTALCEALGRVGDERAALLLSTLALQFITREQNLAEVLALIERAERLAQH